jgi:hypothetical protein
METSMNTSGTDITAGTGQIPVGVVEVTGTSVYSLVELKNGSLLGDNGKLSTDGGRTWSDARSFGDHVTADPSGAIGNGIIRLKSGSIAFANGGKVWLSSDEGETWETGGELWPHLVGPGYYGDEMIQLDSGRLVYPTSMNFNPKHPEFKYEDVLSKGFWKDTTYAIEGHHHLPEIYMTFVGYSDDEGRTWQLAKGLYDIPEALFGWFNEEGFADGRAGTLPYGEATVAETKDGKVLMLGRSTVNRVLYTYSADAAETWLSPLPTVLANSGSPARLRRIPETGDLLCVWNQVSKDEVQRGYRRGRLSSAISRDGGISWGNFRTIELSAGMEDIDRIPAEYPIKMIRANDFVGYLPDEFAYFHYANVCFVADKVFVSYLRGMPMRGLAEQNLPEQETVLRIYPLEWFYD